MDLFSPLQFMSSSPGLRTQPYSGEGLKGPKTSQFSEESHLSQASEDSGAHRVSGQERAAVQKFVREVQNSLDLEANQLEMAFLQVSSLGLQAPPVQQIGELVESLSLESDQAEKAREIFKDLFEATPGRPLEAYIMPGAGGLGILSMMSQGQKQGQLHQSLEDLNQRFFIEQKMLATKKTVVEESTQVSPQPAPSRIGFEKILESSQKTSVEPGQWPLGMVSQVGKSLGAQSPQLLEAEPLEVEPLELEGQEGASNAQRGLRTSESAHPLQPTPEGQRQPGGLQEAQFFKEQPTSSRPSAALEPNLTSMPQTPSSPELSEVVKATDSGISEVGAKDFRGESFQPIVSAAPGSSSSNAATSLSAPLPSLVSRVTSAEPEANINEILNQAQFVAKRGGGEVKVILYPEGLGEVNLKVNVKDGQVNVQMLTQSVEAKKLLETQLGDLRTQLVAQKINVDQIKVETADLARDFSQQQEQQQRHTAQHFMEQFRQENQAFRRGFLDMPGIRAYRSQIHDPAHNEDMVAAAQAARREAMARRLDLVA